MYTGGELPAMILQRLQQEVEREKEIERQKEKGRHMRQTEVVNEDVERQMATIQKGVWRDIEGTR